MVDDQLNSVGTSSDCGSALGDGNRGLAVCIQIGCRTSCICNCMASAVLNSYGNSSAGSVALSSYSIGNGFVCANGSKTSLYTNGNASAGVKC